MQAIIGIGLNTLREYLRDKILYNLLLFAVFLIGGSILLGELTLGEQQRIVTDFGLAAISLIGIIIAIFLGIGLVTKEIDRRTIYTVLARPVGRARFIVGKYLGLALTLAINVTILFAVFLATLLLTGVPVHGGLLLAIELMFVEFLLVTAMALFLSTFSSSTLSAIMTLGAYFIGHLAGDLVGIAEKSESPMIKGVIKGVYYAFPNLELFNVKGQAASGIEIGWFYALSVTGYGLLYAAILLVVACVVFQRREF